MKDDPGYCGHWPYRNRPRITWPNGVLQSDFKQAGDASLLADQRLKGSCPWLFAWNGRAMDVVKAAGGAGYQRPGRAHRVERQAQVAGELVAGPAGQDAERDAGANQAAEFRDQRRGAAGLLATRIDR